MLMSVFINYGACVDNFMFDNLRVIVTYFGVFWHTVSSVYFEIVSGPGILFVYRIIALYNNKLMRLGEFLTFSIEANKITSIIAKNIYFIILLFTIFQLLFTY